MLDKEIMTPIEIIAVILVAVSILKLVILAIKPKIWLRLVEAIYSKPKAMMWVSLILGAMVLYYLLQTMTIVQIVAVMAFMSLLMAVGFSAFPGYIVETAQKAFRRKHLVRRAWLMTIVWVVICVWVLYEIFGYLL